MIISYMSINNDYVRWNADCHAADVSVGVILENSGSTDIIHTYYGTCDHSSSKPITTVVSDGGRASGHFWVSEDSRLLRTVKAGFYNFCLISNYGQLHDRESHLHLINSKRT